MKNYYNDNIEHSFTVSADVVSGQLVAMGSVYGVAKCDADNGETVSLLIRGKVRVDGEVLKFANSATPAIGIPAYIVIATGEIEDDSNMSANPRVGTFLRDPYDGGWLILLNDRT